MSSVADAGFGVGAQNEIGYPVRCHRRLLQVLVLSDFLASECMRVWYCEQGVTTVHRHVCMCEL